MSIEELTQLDRIEAKLDALLPSTPFAEKEILTIGDVEARYGISPHRQRVARNSFENPLGYVMVGNGIRYRREQVNAWIEGQTV